MELTRLPLLKSALKSRYPQLAAFVVMLAGFIFTIVAGLIGTPVGSRNFAIVFVWIAWWAILILAAVPFFGRGWCAVCPIPLPGDWLQRGAVLAPNLSSRSGGSLTSALPAVNPTLESVSYVSPSASVRALRGPRPLSHLRWPRFLRNIWLQNISFLLLALFSTVLLTNPTVTAIVLAAMLFAAVGLSMVFERRAFCRYLCPVGGFIGLYSQTAPIELRIKDKQVCAQCVGKPCYNGSDTGYGCPWDVFPGGLTKNTHCGLCMECLRTCPHDNIAINARPFAADLAKPSARMDEAFKAFIMLGSAMIYAAVLLGSSGTLKDAAYNVGTTAWFIYAAVFLAGIFILLPGLFSIAVTLSPRQLLLPVIASEAKQSHLMTVGLLRREERPPRNDGTSSVVIASEAKQSPSTTVGLLRREAHPPRNDGTARRETFKKRFAQFSNSLIPLGLMFWVAFSLSFVLTNATYILASLSDPLGLGWDLFNTANISWQPLLTSLLAPAQTLALVGGLVWSANVVQKAATEAKVSPIPVIVYCFIVTSIMFWLLL